MDFIRKQWLALLSLVLLIAGWWIAPVIDAKLKGTPLPGLSGKLLFWGALLSQPIAAWIVGLVVIAILVGAAIFFLVWKKRHLDRTGLRIVLLPMPQARWSIGAVGGVPHLSGFFSARLAHTQAISIEIVTAYLEGTTPVGAVIPVIVSGPYDPPAIIHFAVRPILVKDNEVLRRRVMLVDQFNKKHRTDYITFHPSMHPPQSLVPGGVPLKCFFCHEAIAMEELSPVAAVPAHKRCIK